MLRVRALLCEAAAASLQTAMSAASKDALHFKSVVTASRILLPRSSCMTYSSSSGNTEGVEKMLDFIATSPQLQQMMMSALPTHMRRPEVIKSILENPEIKKRVAEMISKQGMGLPPGVLGMMDQQRITETLEQSKSMGIDPSTMFQKLMSRPVLMQKFRDPRIVSAFLEIAQDQSKLAKYQNDREVIEVWFEAKDIMLPQGDESRASGSGQQTQSPSQTGPATVTIIPPQSSSSTPSSDPQGPFQYTAPTASTASTASSPTQGPMPAQSPEASPSSQEAQFQDAGMQQLLSDPARLARLAQAGSNPRVQKALMDISKSKWKLVLYLFDKEVMAALKDLGEVAREAAAKQQK